MRKYCSILHIFILFGICQSSFLWAIQPETRIKNFTKKEYQAANQNWSVDASPNGFIYFANHAGLLEFDGTSWELYKLPYQTILRSVKVVSDTIIFTGGYRELGYWKKDATEKLSYHSLNESAGEHLSQNDEFWTICTLNGEVYFHSFSKILKYSKNTIFRIPFSGFANTMSRVGDKILLGISNQGIFSIENNKAVPFIMDERLQKVSFKFIIPYYTDQILIGTTADGIFLWNGEALNEWNPDLNDYFKKNEVNRAHINSNGELFIGTIVDGLSVFEKNEQRITNYNTLNGLQNNTVLGISSDIFGNTWLALDSGIGFISDNSENGIEIETIPGIGSIYDAAVFENEIYLGTNRGLFSKASGVREADYQFIPESRGQVWNCSVFNNHFFVGFNRGVLNIQKEKIHLISEQAGGFSLREDPFVPGRLIESTYTNMVILEQRNSVYRQTGIIKGFYDLIRYIEFDHRGNLWASHMHRGIYKLQLNSSRDSVVNIQYYGENSALKKDHSIHLFKVENRIVFTTEEELFTYNDLNDSIVPYHLLNEKLGEFTTAHRIVPAPHHHYWFITKDKIGLFLIRENEAELIKSVPKQLFAPHEMIDGFENILPLTSTKAIVCLENGIARFDVEQTDTLTKIINFAPSLREILLINNQGGQRIIPGNRPHIKIKHRYNNVHLRYAFPLFSNQPIYFQAMLEGIDQDWSAKKTKPVFAFDRLPPGEFILLIKATDAWENESKQHKLFIEILPPWYLTSYAKGGYVVAFLFFVLGMQIWGVKRTRKKERRRLEKREQELIKLRNEKLRNEIEHKSKELANSTMAIIKKNEFLLKLKQTLSRHKNQLGSRYPGKYYLSLTKEIDNNITSQDDWQVFETNFERAHEQFLHKIKEMYPDLTPNDLRLCAFLRMNLSSKEIAPLLGISVRGVENHRYRLRKKMKLEHDDNLIEVILNL